MAERIDILAKAVGAQYMNQKNIIEREKPDSNEVKIYKVGGQTLVMKAKQNSSSSNQLKVKPILTISIQTGNTEYTANKATEPLHHLINLADARIIEAKKYKQEVFFKGIDNGNIEAVKAGIKDGVDVNALNNYAIRASSSGGHTDIVQILIDAGANYHIENDYVICLASYGNHINTVNLFIANGLDVQAHDNLSLYYAVRDNNFELAKLLLENGANPNGRNGAIISYAKAIDNKMEYLLKRYITTTS